SYTTLFRYRQHSAHAFSARVREQGPRDARWNRNVDRYAADRHRPRHHRWLRGGGGIPGHHGGLRRQRGALGIDADRHGHAFGATAAAVRQARPLRRGRRAREVERRGRMNRSWGGSVTDWW